MCSSQLQSLCKCHNSTLRRCILGFPGFQIQATFASKDIQPLVFFMPLPKYTPRDMATGRNYKAQQMDSLPLTHNTLCEFPGALILCIMHIVLFLSSCYVNMHIHFYARGPETECAVTLFLSHKSVPRECVFQGCPTRVPCISFSGVRRC